MDRDKLIVINDPGRIEIRDGHRVRVGRQPFQPVRPFDRIELDPDGIPTGRTLRRVPDRLPTAPPPATL